MVIRKSAIFVLALLSLSVPAVEGGVMLDRAVAYAAPKSGASLEQICKGAYEAAKESPAEAHVVFEKIIAQRKNWNASQVYAVLRSIMLAVPDLEPAVARAMKTESPSAVIPVEGYKGNVGVYHAGGEQGAYEEGASDMWLVANGIVNVLSALELPPGVANDVKRNVIVNSTAAPAVSAHISRNSLDTNTNSSLPAPEFIAVPEPVPTPEPVTPVR